MNIAWIIVLFIILMTWTPICLLVMEATYDNPQTATLIPIIFGGLSFAPLLLCGYLAYAY